MNKEDIVRQSCVELRVLLVIMLTCYSLHIASILQDFLVQEILANIYLFECIKMNDIWLSLYISQLSH